MEIMRVCPCKGKTETRRLIGKSKSNNARRWGSNFLMHFLAEATHLFYSSKRLTYANKNSILIFCGKKPNFLVHFLLVLLLQTKKFSLSVFNILSKFHNLSQEFQVFLENPRT